MRLRDRVEPVVLALVTLGAVARGSDGVTVLTAALVLLTAYYAFQTRAMVNQSREEHREAVTQRDWDREEAAARCLLAQFDAALTVSARGGALLLHEQPDIVVHLVDALGDHAFELNDQELQRRKLTHRCRSPRASAPRGVTASGNFLSRGVWVRVLPRHRYALACP